MHIRSTCIRQICSNVRLVVQRNKENIRLMHILSEVLVLRHRSSVTMADESTEPEPKLPRTTIQSSPSMRRYSLGRLLPSPPFSLSQRRTSLTTPLSAVHVPRKSTPATPAYMQSQALGHVSNDKRSGPTRRRVVETTQPTPEPWEIHMMEVRDLLSCQPT